MPFATPLGPESFRSARSRFRYTAPTSQRIFAWLFGRGGGSSVKVKIPGPWFLPGDDAGAAGTGDRSPLLPRVPTLVGAAAKYLSDEARQSDVPVNACAGGSGRTR